MTLEETKKLQKEDWVIVENKFYKFEGITFIEDQPICFDLFDILRKELFSVPFHEFSHLQKPMEIPVEIIAVSDLIKMGF